ncbi:short-chain dehydrogenase [Thalassobacillus devorans]|uniref:short-chain dehydrogenase n=1 Tax=Thalassobacillus devorans TaxID=279813 RepID=UPI0015934A33|nr:short-chain dehydrogenase [Thalassobacillus devorans]
MKHALVIGGTGMLAETTLWLADQGYHVSVVVRNKQKMDKLIERSTRSDKLIPVLVDYKNTEGLIHRLREDFERHGTPQLVVAWIHSDAGKAREVILHEVAKATVPFNLYIILGSSHNRDVFRQEINVPDHGTLHIVQLGYVVEGNRSKWLVHDEIAHGVIDAIRNEKMEHVVGVLEPWEHRP